MVKGMTVDDLLVELEGQYEAFVELCGEDDEICTLPAKEKYEQLLSIIEYVESNKKLAKDK
jgi:hypothetical protein